MRCAAAVLLLAAACAAMPAPLLSLSKEGLKAPARPTIAADFLADTEVEFHNATTGEATFGEGASSCSALRALR